MDPNRDDPIEESDGEGNRDPSVVPAISSEQMPFTEGMGLASYSPRAEEEADADNDQESHASPSDNDGETVPRDEVVDQAGG